MYDLRLLTSYASRNLLIRYLYDLFNDLYLQRFDRCVQDLRGDRYVAHFRFVSFTSGRFRSASQCLTQCPMFYNFDLTLCSFEAFSWNRRSSSTSSGSCNWRYGRDRRSVITLDLFRVSMLFWGSR